MRSRTRFFVSFFLFLGASGLAGPGAGRAQAPAAAPPRPPSVEFGQLYRDVELGAIFPDSKTFPDRVPQQSPATILEAYQAAKTEAGSSFDLKSFVDLYFKPETDTATDLKAPPGQSVQDYIANAWNVLQRQAQPGQVPAYSSLLPLPYPFVVPGGRFTELYYWDTYFTALGLEQSNRHDLSLNLVKDFASEIDQYGHVPNGSRSYYLSRSQPPFFSLLVELIAKRDGESTYVTYLPELVKEYQFWMAGADTLAPGQAYRRAVRISGVVLNRYYDNRNAPRDESYREDVATAASVPNRPAKQLYRDLRATAESGWDFSSRWFADGKTLATVRTTSLLPVDLNSLLVHLELTISKGYLAQGDQRMASVYHRKADKRQRAINRLMWDEGQGVYTDYDWQTRELTHTVTAATVYPLFFHVASPDRAAVVADTVRAQLLLPGGLATTTVNSGQQWDLPNGWAPLQWLAVSGFNDYGQTDLAQTIAQRWIQKNLLGFRAERTLVEKYDVTTTSGPTAGSGGEYNVQVGFGWTNGVLLQLLALYPQPVTSAAGR